MDQRELCYRGHNQKKTLLDWNVEQEGYCRSIQSRTNGSLHHNLAGRKSYAISVDQYQTLPEQCVAPPKKIEPHHGPTVAIRYRYHTLPPVRFQMYDHYSTQHGNL
jgi:hypothetical protein